MSYSVIWRQVQISPLGPVYPLFHGRTGRTRTITMTWNGAELLDELAHQCRSWTCSDWERVWAVVWEVNWRRMDAYVGENIRMLSSPVARETTDRTLNRTRKRRLMLAKAAMCAVRR